MAYVPQPDGSFVWVDDQPLPPGPPPPPAQPPLPPAMPSPPSPQMGPAGMFGVPGAPAGPPPPAMPAPPTDARNAPAIEGSEEFSNDRIDAAAAKSQMRKDVLNVPWPNGLGGRMLPPVQDPGTEALRIGGAQGLENFHAATETAPNAAVEATRNEGAVAAREGKETAEAIKKHSADIAALSADQQWERENRGIDMQQRVQQLDAATQRYTNDLRDSGQYWHNPGNVLAAIGAAFVGFGARDPKVGADLINRQVMNDFQKRKSAADMHLGELRSNINAYRQIMGDKDAGDAMALAEAQRAAIDDLRRIGAQFQGERYQAATEKMASVMEQQNAVFRMEAWNRYLHVPAQRKDPGVLAAEQKAGKAFPGVGYTPYTSMPQAKPTSNPGNPAAPWLQNYARGEGIENEPIPQPQTKGGQINAAMRTATGQPTPIDNVIDSKLGKKLYDKRMPGASSIVALAKDRLANDVLIDVMAKHPAGGVTKAMLMSEANKRYADSEAKAANIAKLAVEKGVNPKGWGWFKTEVQKVKAAAPLFGVSEDEFLGRLRDVSPAWQNTLNTMRQKYSNPTNAHEAQIRDQLDAAVRFNQMVSGKQVGFYRENIGGAQSQQELENLRPVISQSSSFAQIEGFADMQDRANAEKWSSVLGSDPDDLAQAILQVDYGMRLPTLNRPRVAPGKK